MPDDLKSARLKRDIRDATYAVGRDIGQDEVALAIVSIFIIELTERGITFEYLSDRG